MAVYYLVKRKLGEDMGGKETGEKLKKVPIEYLWDGLVLSDNIYNYNGSVLLVPGGEVITQHKIEKLMHFETDNGYIMTGEESSRIIFEGKSVPVEIRQKNYEERLGYTSLKKSVEHILLVSRTASEINTSMAESVVDDVVSKLFEVEASRIFQCLEAARTMDEDLQRHSLNVAFTNGMMGQWMKLPEEDVRQLVCAGLLHDIGKTKIPESILYAPRKLTEEEFEIMKLHPIFSDELLGEDIDEKIRRAVRCHHEKLDGSGYPDKICGDKVTLFARITAISDIYDAMISKRSYKDSVIVFDILERFFNLEFSGLDNELVCFFVKNMTKYYRGERVIMSDGSEGTVEYIPPNDISHPIVSVDHRLRQSDELWCCVNLSYFN